MSTIAVVTVTRMIGTGVWRSVSMAGTRLRLSEESRVKANFVFLDFSVIVSRINNRLEGS